MRRALRATVVVRSKDEADRLRLTLASLGRQDEAAEVVVVDDGSSDHTQEVLDEVSRDFPIVRLRNETPAGRSGAANLGAEAAQGEVLIFLDGDTLAAPDFVRAHMDLHRATPDLIVRGQCFHLRCTRFFRNPETGAPRPEEADRVARMSEAELSRSLVTRAQVLKDFVSIERRAQPGIYPGHGPRRIAEIEMDALQGSAPPHILWIAASGSNQSVGRSAFLASGGFRPDLSINEHRELALRLCQMGQRMAACGARTFHLTHRIGWRDPLLETSWEEIFFTHHPLAEVALMPLLWESLSETSALPPEARIMSLAELASAAERRRGLDDRLEIRRRHIAETATGKVAQGALTR